MEAELNAVRQAGKAGNWWNANRVGARRVLLREPEMCAECGGVFLSLYPLRSCFDHDGLDKI